MKTSAIGKSLAMMALLGAAALFSTGCSSEHGLHNDLLGPPGYSAGENAQREFRYAAFDFQEAVDDFDQNVTMSRPGSMLTRWNILRSD
jgi:hypothetical protein